MTGLPGRSDFVFEIIFAGLVRSITFFRLILTLSPRVASEKTGLPRLISLATRPPAGCDRAGKAERCLPARESAPESG